MREALKSMARDRFGRAIVPMLAVLGWLVLMPASASAQSGFTGRVTDGTGAVLPGVTVEAASPALIEKVRTAVTDGEGRYAIADLRPGSYTLTFQLTGFATVVRDQINLTTDFKMTLNVEMRVGGLEETITVSGDAPIVDVTQTLRSEVMSRDVIDALPTGRTVQARAALVPLVQATLDVGGSQSMDQHNMRVAGTEDNEASVFVDGMMLNSNSSDGASQYYFNDAMAQELSISTSGADAEISGGGVRINLTPREGGNLVSGTFYADGANASMMSSNLSPALRSEGVDSVNRLHRAFDINGSLGGPVMPSKLWWFFTGHRKAVDRVVLGSFYPDGSPGIDDTLIHAVQLRLTWQATAKHKFSAFYDDNNKVEYHTHSAGEDILTASQTRGVNKKGPRYAAQVKWTSAMSSRLMAEAGWGTNRVDYVNRGQEGLRQERPLGVRTCVATPCLSFDPNQVGPNLDPWYTVLSNFDPEAPLERWGNVTDDFGKVPQRYLVTSKVTYVTGSHNFKTGVQWNFGPENWWRINNGDIQSVEYRAGVPESVVVANTPVNSSAQVNYDLGIYAQDSWTLGRLTLSPGVRFEWFNAQVNTQNAPAGRFVLGREFVEMNDLPNWFDVSPRLGVAYDVFGTARTAVKFDVGKYVHNLTLSVPDRYNPMFSTTDRRFWFDCYMDVSGRSCSGANPYGTNGDRIVQDWEIGPSGVSNFGSRIVNRMDPDFSRPYYVRMGLSVDHEVLPRVGLNAGWYFTEYKNQRTVLDQRGVLVPYTTNLARNLNDYQAFQVANPLPGYEGQMITVYNLRRDKLGLVDNLDTNAPNARSYYHGFVFGARARLRGSLNIFGGVTLERSTNSYCDAPDDPNRLRFCDTTGGAGEAESLSAMTVPGAIESGWRGTLPFQAAVRMGADYRLPYGVQVSAAVRSQPGAERIITWSVPASAFTAAGLTRTQTVTVRLNDPGSLYYDRVNVIDIGVGKWFELPGRLRWKLGANFYNILNPDTITGRTNTFGGTLGRPTSVILGRFWRASTQVEW